jgi:serine/threonine protein kinase
MRQCPTCGTKYWGDSERVCPNDGATLQDVVIANDRTRLLGAVIHGRYLVDGVLGDGGMGVVYRARGVADGRPYAVKVLRAEFTNEQDLVARFEVEARAVAAVQHPNIVQVFEFGALEDGSRFFVMELLEGKPLSLIMHEAGRVPEGQRRPIDAGLAVKIARQICAGLGAAHAVGIVHRDMKPDNVHVIQRGEDRDFVKILDFGIAKVAGSQAAKTRTGSVFGTPQYMSPEQASGERDIDARTDIYATGILLYEMVTGRLPFDSENLMAILAAHMYQPPVRPRTIPLVKQVSPALEAVLLKALAKDRFLRYQSMEAFGEDLARIERGADPVALGDAEPTVVRDGDRASMAPPAIQPGLSAVGPQATISPVTRSMRATGQRAGRANPVVWALSIVGAVSFVGAGAMIARRARADAGNGGAPAVTVSRSTNVGATRGNPAEGVRVDTQPQGAELLANGGFVCRTPCMLPRPTRGGGSISYVVNAAGFEPSTFSLSPDSAPHIQLVLPPRATDPSRRGVGRAPRAPRPDEGGSQRRPPTSTAPAQGTGPAPQGSPSTEPATGPASPLLNPWR